MLANQALGWFTINSDSLIMRVPQPLVDFTGFHALSVNRYTGMPGREADMQGGRHRLGMNPGRQTGNGAFELPINLYTFLSRGVLSLALSLFALSLALARRMLILVMVAMAMYCWCHCCF